MKDRETRTPTQLFPVPQASISLGCLGRKPPRAPQLEETPETPPSSRAEGLLFLHGLEIISAQLRDSGDSTEQAG